MGKTAKTKSKVKVHRIIESRTDFFYYAFRNILLVSVPLLVVFSVVLSHLSFHSSATSSSSGIDQIQFSLSSSCTMSSVVDEAHIKEINNGTYHSDVGKTTITTLCNDGNGYSVYAVGYSNNEEGNNKLINSERPEYSIDTGLNTSGLTSAWAMKLNNLENDPSTTPPVIESAYDDTYGLVPNNWAKVASRSSGTTDMSLGSSFTTTYSIYTSSSQFAGTYRGQVKYALLHPYSNNNTPSFDSFDKAFAFYEKTKVTVTDPITGQAGSYYKMQDMNSNICNLTTVHGEASATQLVDTRDNKLYWIAKLDDEHCWMTQNLDLDLSHEVALTSETSDIDPSSYGTGIYAETTGYSRNATTGVVSWTPSTIDSGDVQRADTIAMSSNTASGWANDYNHPYSADAGDRYRYTDSTGIETVYTSLSACLANTNNDKAGCQHMHLGNYYNWTTAIASNDTSSAPDNPTLGNSICPKNWDLPANGKYNTMLSTQSITTNYSPNGFLKIRTSPLYFVRSGYINGGSISSGGQGHYWSSTVINRTNSDNLSFGDNYIATSGSDNRGLGFPLRCVAR